MTEKWLIENGGKVWEKYGKRRIYMNELGSRFASQLVKRSQRELNSGKIWFDLESQTWGWSGVNDATAGWAIAHLEKEFASEA